jgi:separase
VSRQQPSLNLFACHCSSAVDDLHRITGKVERTWERMRRAAVKMIDRTVPSIGDTDEGRERVRALLVAVVDVLGASLQAASLFSLVFLKCSNFSLVAQKQTPDLDTLFAFARTGLNVADPRTHNAAYDHLERAVVILRIGEDTPNHPRVAPLTYSLSIT